jgi:hypothetical protein
MGLDGEQVGAQILTVPEASVMGSYKIPQKS